jgi:hypothetical protein
MSHSRFYAFRRVNSTEIFRFRHSYPRNRFFLPGFASGPAESPAAGGASGFRPMAEVPDFTFSNRSNSFGLWIEKKNFAPARGSSGNGPESTGISSPLPLFLGNIKSYKMLQKTGGILHLVSPCPRIPNSFLELAGESRPGRSGIGDFRGLHIESIFLKIILKIIMLHLGRPGKLCRARREIVKIGRGELPYSTFISPVRSLPCGPGNHNFIP